MVSMKTLITRMYRTVRRVFPQCQIVAEATAYSMFLAFFPILLLGLGILHGAKWGASAVLQMWFRLQLFCRLKVPTSLAHISVVTAKALCDGLLSVFSELCSSAPV